MSPADFLANVHASLMAYFYAARSSPSEILAITAVIVGGAFVLSAGFVKTMIPLRWLAIGSNVGFVCYGALHPSYPMLILHLLLLPLNIFRLKEMVQLTRRVNAVEQSGDLSGIWLRPYMRSETHADGSLLFRKGDRGDRLYLLAEGQIEFVEIGTHLDPGQIFGEIAFFAPDRRRQLSARCKGKCTILSIDESTMRQLYHQNPEFGFQLISLVAGRLSADVHRLTNQLHGNQTT